MPFTRFDYNILRSRDISIFPPRVSFLTALGIIAALSCSAIASPVTHSAQIELTTTSHQTSQIDPNLVLKMTLQLMMQLLEEIEDTQNILEVKTTLLATLEGDAAGVIFGYASSGLSSTLTLQDISIGIQNGEDALNILRNNSNNIQLSSSTKASLDSTLESMVNELNSII